MDNVAATPRSIPTQAAPKQPWRSPSFHRVSLAETAMGPNPAGDSNASS